MSNQVQPKKLLHSKWTAVNPTRREKHFIVTDVQLDDQSQPVTCTLQAVHSGRERELVWRALKDATEWQIGWQ